MANRGKLTHTVWQDIYPWKSIGEIPSIKAEQHQVFHVITLKTDPLLLTLDLYFLIHFLVMSIL